MLAHDRRHAFGPWVFAAAAAVLSSASLQHTLYARRNGKPRHPRVALFRVHGPGAGRAAAGSGAARGGGFRRGLEQRLCRARPFCAPAGGATCAQRSPPPAWAAGWRRFWGGWRSSCFCTSSTGATWPWPRRCSALKAPWAWPLPGRPAMSAYFAGALLVQFAAGAFWALAALAFSAYVPNVLWTVCLPLILYRLFLELNAWTDLPCG